MKCPRCQAENDAGARFCEDCGARLEAACLSCGTPVTPGKKFCRSCGAALTTEPAGRFASPESYTPKHLAEKILTSKSALEGELRREHAWSNQLTMHLRPGSVATCSTDAAALGFAGLPRLSYDRALWALRFWLDSWSGIGDIERGMERQGFDLQLTRYDEKGWRATLPSIVFGILGRSCPGSGGKEKWRILPVGEVHDQRAALQGGHRRNTPWARVSASQSKRMSLSPSR